MKDIKINISICDSYYNIDYGNISINYLDWLEDDKGVKVMGTILANESNIDNVFAKILSDDELYSIKNMLYTAPLEHLVLSSHIVFFHYNLKRIITAHNKSLISINFIGKTNYNLNLVNLIRKIVSPYKNVTINKPPIFCNLKSVYNNTRLRLYPFLIFSHYLFESLMPKFNHAKKDKRLSNNIILSNFRHYAAEDKSNIFWGNFVKLLEMTTHEKPDVIYYVPPSSISFDYYRTQLLDNNHIFLNDYISFKDFFINLAKYWKYSKYAKTKVKYIYDEIDYSEFIHPLFKFFFYVVYPMTNKNRLILERFTENKSAILYSDSELNLVSLNLGFMGTNCRLVVISNEVITDYYSAIPFVKGKKRPLFHKLVYNESALKLLKHNYNYPKNRMIVFPDPRFLDIIFDSLNTTATILFISQTWSSFYTFANNFNRIFKASNLVRKFNLLFKPHPAENLSKMASLDKNIRVLKEKKLDFIPKYAVNKSSTLGLELLLNGSIVFFLSNKYYDIDKHLPFLICATEQEVLDKIMLLEKNPASFKKLVRDINKFALKEYGLDKKSVLLAKFKKIINSLKN